MSANSNIKAMILAAGRGKRLRPITDDIPKPLVAVNGKPLIEYHLEKLSAAGVTEVVINHAWLGEKLEKTLGDGSRWQLNIHYSAEPEGGLETAGGIINALPLLGDQPFVVVNGDVYSDYDYGQLIKQAQAMRASDLLGHLVVVPSPEHNPNGDFGLTADNMLQAQGSYTFAGLSVLSPKLFAGMSVDFIALAPILREAMQQGLISGCLSENYWSDVGTIERLQATEAELQKRI